MISIIFRVGFQRPQNRRLRLGTPESDDDDDDDEEDAADDDDDGYAKQTV